jgi:hypothetical protein
MDAIATAVQRDAQADGVGRYSTPDRKLHYTLQHRPEAMVLSITRRDRYPSAQEEAHARSAYCVPADAGRSQFMQSGYYIVRYAWPTDECRRLTAAGSDPRQLTMEDIP